MLFYILVVIGWLVPAIYIISIITENKLLEMKLTKVLKEFAISLGIGTTLLLIAYLVR